MVAVFERRRREGVRAVSHDAEVRKVQPARQAYASMLRRQRDSSCAVNSCSRARVGFKGAFNDMRGTARVAPLALRLLPVATARHAR